jgi:hypothetical protein
MVDTKLVGAGWPDGCVAEASAEWTRAWVVAAELVVDPRDAAARCAPAPVGLQLSSRWHNQCDWSTICRVGIISVPVVHRRASLGAT